MKNLSVSLIQFNIEWENPFENRKKIDTLLPDANATDLVILPEMFTTGFTLNASQLAETMDGETIRWMKEKSSERGFALCGSIIIRENNRFYNRFILISPDGDIQYYDKRHLFSYGKENRYFEKGKERKIIEFRGWKILMQICYDLRFPVWSRNRGDYDLAIYVASWPEQRSWVWEHLLISRAIENQAYVIGVNRVGVDGYNLAYDGRSMVIAPTGHCIAKTKPFNLERLDILLEFEKINEWRSTFPALSDADDFTLQ
ncbi:MAG TPA: amidohydrolase [Salinivirgaceae bacterium]|nr:amidohydrolase [Salinivirgaceae bacterium]